MEENKEELENNEINSQKKNTQESEEESISQFFHILGSVEQQRGCVHMGNDQYEITIYSSCCNLDTGIYYYKTYDNSRIIGVDMNGEPLEGSTLVNYELMKKQDILMQNI